MFGFSTVLVICDGASANLKLLKILCGEKAGVYSARENEGRYSVKTTFVNVFTNKQVHVMICPSNQLKQNGCGTLFIRVSEKLSHDMTRPT